jgi:hypothetical protein
MPLHADDVTVLQAVFGEEVVGKINQILPEGDIQLGLNLGGRTLVNPDEYKKKLNEMREAGIEIGVKEVAKMAGLTLGEGEKKADIVAKKLQDTIKAQLAEEYKNPTPAAELERALQSAMDWKTKYETLDQTHQTVVAEKEQLGQTLEQKVQEYKQKEEYTRIMSSIPKEVKVKSEYAVALVKAGVTTDTDENGNTVYRDKETGKMYINAASQPLSLEDTLKVFFQKSGLIPEAGGGTPQDSNPTVGLGLSPDAAFKRLKDEGIDPMSPDGLKKYAEYIKK